MDVEDTVLEARVVLDSEAVELDVLDALPDSVVLGLAVVVRLALVVAVPDRVPVEVLEDVEVTVEVFVGGGLCVFAGLAVPVREDDAEREATGLGAAVREGKLVAVKKADGIAVRVAVDVRVVDLDVVAVSVGRRLLITKRRGSIAYSVGRADPRNRESIASKDTTLIGHSL